MSERDPRTYAIIGAAMAVHQELGRGFLEAVYQEALMREMSAANIPFLREVDLPIFYKGSPLTVHYRCLLYTSPSPRDRTRYRMPSSA